MGRIRKLPAERIREIAAGEVISAPCDVVKELLENALDAGATRLDVQLEEGGKAAIIVSDNGSGIASDDLPLAAQVHSSSKLEPLHALRSLGFRGEGLYAIANAGHLRITSRPRGQLGGATLDCLEPGSRCAKTYDNADVHSHPAPLGTRVELRQLFAHLPARRRALESAAVESRKISQLLSMYLLHYPQVVLSLRSDAEADWVYAGGSFREAVKFFWGAVTANRLLSIDVAHSVHPAQDSTQNLAQEDSAQDSLKISAQDPTQDSMNESSAQAGSAQNPRQPIRLQGLLSRPELRRPRRDRLLLAINGRPVQWPALLQQALLRAYRERLPAGSYPVGVLNLELPPEWLLVNTAPDKRQVQLLEPEPLCRFVEDSLHHLLESHSPSLPLPDFQALTEDGMASGVSAGVNSGVSSAARRAFPPLRYIGSYRQLYLLAESQGQLWVIDQHAAHERILYEHLQAQCRRQAPLELHAPELISLSPEEALRYSERRDVLRQAGLWLEPFGAQSWRLRLIPAFLAGHEDLLAQVIKDCLNPRYPDPWQKVLARLACLPAIKAGYPLTPDDAEQLLEHLAHCDIPWACPHGRPTALVMEELDLARRFGRRHSRAVSASKPHAAQENSVPSALSSLQTLPAQGALFDSADDAFDEAEGKLEPTPANIARSATATSHDETSE